MSSAPRPPYPFLSESWISAAMELRDRHLGEATAALPEGLTVRLNQTITDVPHGDGYIDAHLAVDSGVVDIDLGHVDAEDATLTFAYDFAEELFWNGPSELMRGLLQGRLRIDGDMAKLIALQAGLAQQAPAGGEDRLRSIVSELQSNTVPRA